MYGNKEQEKYIDAETLKKLLMKGDEDEFMTGGGVITMTPNNHIYFYCDVLPDSVLKLNNVLVQMMKESLSEAATKGRIPDPIHLHIQSNGGLVSAGFIGYDVITEINKFVDVHTHIDGYAASAATLLSVAGKKRFMTPSSTVLIHELSTYIGGKLSEITNEYANCKLIENKLEEIYLRHTKFKKEELQELLKKDVLLDAEKALEKSLVDEIKTVVF